MSGTQMGVARHFRINYFDRWRFLLGHCVLTVWSKSAPTLEDLRSVALTSLGHALAEGTFTVLPDGGGPVGANPSNVRYLTVREKGQQAVIVSEAVDLSTLGGG